MLNSCLVVQIFVCLVIRSYQFLQWHWLFSRLFFEWCCVDWRGNVICYLLDVCTNIVFVFWALSQTKSVMGWSLVARSELSLHDRLDLCSSNQHQVSFCILHCPILKHVKMFEEWYEMLWLDFFNAQQSQGIRVNPYATFSTLFAMILLSKSV